MTDESLFQVVELVDTLMRTRIPDERITINPEKLPGKVANKTHRTLFLRTEQNWVEIWIEEGFTGEEIKGIKDFFKGKAKLTFESGPLLRWRWKPELEKE